MEEREAKRGVRKVKEGQGVGEKEKEGERVKERREERNGEGEE